MTLSSTCVVEVPRLLLLEIPLPSCQDPTFGRAVGLAQAELTNYVLHQQLGGGRVAVRRNDGGEATAVITVEDEPPPNCEYVRGEWPASKMIRGIWQGDFASLPEGIVQLRDWAKEEGCIVGSTSWEIPITGAFDVKDPRQARTQIYLEVSNSPY